jgi:hypothetical protein
MNYCGCSTSQVNCRKCKNVKKFATHCICRYCNEWVEIKQHRFGKKIVNSFYIRHSWKKQDEFMTPKNEFSSVACRSCFEKINLKEKVCVICKTNKPKIKRNLVCGECLNDYFYFCEEHLFFYRKGLACPSCYLVRDNLTEKNQEIIVSSDALKWDYTRWENSVEQLELGLWRD